LSFVSCLIYKTLVPYDPVSDSTMSAVELAGQSDQKKRVALANRPP
jgi:hypothetical protein